MLKRLAFLAAALGVGLVAMAASATAAGEKTITGAQFARLADQICARDTKAKAALGPGLVNADLVSRAHLPKAAAYLAKIVAITATKLEQLAALPSTAAGMPERYTLLAGGYAILADESRALTAAHQGDLGGFRTTFHRIAVHGHPGADSIAFQRAFKAAAKIFPFHTCGTSSSVYP
jgi:hypothetical protein